MSVTSQEWKGSLLIIKAINSSLISSNWFSRLLSGLHHVDTFTSFALLRASAALTKSSLCDMFAVYLLNLFAEIRVAKPC